ncbi:FtsX-like permease family protein [Chryseolinea sp. T2]|uniref:ABC transporter permease n=1 Tax=Chryseolinea sp. T2 TaxID=3129255 RepID=UPI0030774C77
MSTRVLKVIRDLKLEYGRSAMLITAIFIGATAIGIILGAYAVLKREMRNNYMGTVPASATLEVDDSISTDILNAARKFDGVLLADRRATITARMKVDGRWFHLLLFVADDFSDLHTNKFTPVSGKVIPGRGEMLVEQTAFGVMHAAEGDSLLVKLEDREIKIKLSGTVHDPSLAPAWQEQAGYGYISMSTLKLLNPEARFNQLRIVVTERSDSREHITKISRALSDHLAGMSVGVHEIQVPSPGRHPHESQLTTVMTIFVVFSLLILVLASILVSTVMETVMIKEIRQIGVMKTIGGRTGQIFVIYLLSIAILSGAGCMLAIPTARLGAAAFYNMLAGLLNITVHDNSIPFWTTMALIFAGTMIPLVAAAIPVLRGSRVSVKKAISNFGSSQRISNITLAITKYIELLFGSQLFRIAVRNVLRQQRRLTMTVLLLAIAGAVFMTALNVSAAWDKNLSRLYVQKKFDFDVRFDSSVDTVMIGRELKQVNGIHTYEFWSMLSASAEIKDKLSITRTYPDKGHGSFNIAGLPPNTELLNPTVRLGQWLNDQHPEGIVLNQLAAAQIEDAKPGKDIELMAEGVVTRWKIIGITEDVGTPATAYVLLDALMKQRESSVNTLRVAYKDRSYENAVANNESIEKLLQSLSVPVAFALPVWVLRNAVAAHMKILVDTLLTLSLLMAVVGTLTLISSMSISILERTREFGILRTIGATPSRVIRLVVYEVGCVSILSLAVAFPLSLGLSTYLSYLVGALSFGTPLSLTVSYPGILEWTALLIVVGLTASIAPSIRANSITIREAIAFE